MQKYTTIEAFMQSLNEERAEQVSRLRTTIKNAHPELIEHIKWNSPSYTLNGDDRITFSVRPRHPVAVVLHMGATRVENKQGLPVMDDPSGLIDWKSDIRGVITFADLDDVQSKERQFADIINQWLKVRDITMSYSQKYVLVHFLSPIKDDVQFPMSDWVPHVTLADVFAIDRHGTNVDEKLANLLAQRETAETKAIGNDTLGITPVILLQKTLSLAALHMAIVSLLEENGAVFNHPEFTKEGFLPHSTIQKSGRAHVDDMITVDSISLVDMYPDNDWEQRRVLATFNMKEHLMSSTACAIMLP